MSESAFPYLDETVDFIFPERRKGEDLVAIGGNLSPGMLLSAYRRGIFPWFNSDSQPIAWHSLDPRAVLYPQDLHISASMRKLLKQRRFEVKLDANFNQVVEACASAARKAQSGTWITDNMKKAYGKLHQLGYAHCCAAFSGGQFAGGLYGVNLGRVFFGESMVSLQPNASKFAFIKLALYLKEKGLLLIDCQQASPHMASLGSKTIKRKTFEEILQKNSAYASWRGNWSSLFADF